MTCFSLWGERPKPEKAQIAIDYGEVFLTAGAVFNPRQKLGEDWHADTDLRTRGSYLLDALVNVFAAKNAVRG
jgi:hypothetical protein